MMEIFFQNHMPSTIRGSVIQRPATQKAKSPSPSQPEISPRKRKFSESSPRFITVGLNSRTFTGATDEGEQERQAEDASHETEILRQPCLTDLSGGTRTQELNLILANSKTPSEQQSTDGRSVTTLESPTHATHRIHATSNTMQSSMQMMFSYNLSSGAMESVHPLGQSRSRTPASTSFQGRNKGGRPKTKPSASRPLTKCYKKSTVLRVNRPVEARLPMDVWNRILNYCKPDLLVKLRLVSQGFRDAISNDIIWKDSLIQEFGPLLPEPPQGLSYMHYANLLTSNGCQACHEERRGKARRTYWAFQRRYCEPCLTERVVFVCFPNFMVVEA